MKECSTNYYYYNYKAYKLTVMLVQVLSQLEMLAWYGYLYAKNSTIEASIENISPLWAEPNVNMFPLWQVTIGTVK
mgnify:CR=1 FL=1